MKPEPEAQWQISWPLVYPSNTHAERAAILKDRTNALGVTTEAIRAKILRDLEDLKNHEYRT